MGILGNLYDTVELGHFNWPFRNSHPVHPATVHFPLSFLTAAYALDTLYGATTRYPMLRALAPYLGDIGKFSYVSHAIGVVTALPSITSGSAELWELYKSNGLNRRDKQLTNPGASGAKVVDASVKIGLWHGALNFVALGVSTYALWARRGRPGFAPTRANVLLSALTIPGVAISAALGGELVYGKGVGVQRMGPARDEKVEGMREYKEGKKGE